MKKRSGTPRARWPLALVALAALWGTALYVGLGAIWVAALLCALFLLTDLITFFACLSGTQVYQTMSVPECVTGELLTLEAEVRGPAAAGLCVYAFRRAENTYFEERMPALAWHTLRSLKVSLPVHAVDVGLQYAGIVSLRLYSPLGMFSAVLKLGTALREGPRPVLVLPRLRPVDEPLFGEGTGLGQRDRRIFAAGDVDSVSGSREYQEGDPLSRVNWKLTAARRDLYVKEFDSVGLRESSVLYVAPFPHALRQNALEAALAGGALLLKGNDLTLRLDRETHVVRRGDITQLARVLAHCPDRVSDISGQNDALAALSDERACCAVLTDGDTRTCRQLGSLPRGSLAFALGAPGWRRDAIRACRLGNVNLCIERTGEGWQWLRA